jgi:hypothetical protein
VNVKALHVTNTKSECSRRCGAAKSTKQLEETVLGADEVMTPPNCRSSWFITSNYDLGAAFMKTKRLNIRSAKPIAPPIALAPLAPPIEPVQGDPPSENNLEEANMPQNMPRNVPPPVPPLPPSPAPELTTIAHQTGEWWDDHDATPLPMGGGVPQIDWNICALVDNLLGPGSDGRKDLSGLDYLLLMFLPDQLAVIVTLTS